MLLAYLLERYFFYVLLVIRFYRQFRNDSFACETERSDDLNRLTFFSEESPIHTEKLSCSFNRDNHGYYYGTLKCTLFNDGNSISFTRRGDANTYFNEIPLILDPEGKHTVRENVDIDLGAVRTSSNVRFDLNFFNCIERSRFDQAIFSSPDAAIQGLYGASSFQKYFGTSIPMYPVPTANQTDQVTSFPTPQQRF